MKNTPVEMQNKLMLETLRRSHSSLIYQPFLFSILLSLHFNLFSSDIFLTIGATLTYALFGLRYLVYNYGKNKGDVKSIFQTYLTLVISNAALYGLMCAYVMASENSLTQPVIIFVYFCTGVLTASMSNLAPSAFYQMYYLVAISAPVILTTLHPGLDPLFRSTGIFYSIYVGFIFSIGRMMNKDIIKTYTSVFKSSELSEQLKNVIDLVPGFVGLTDELGQWKIKSKNFDLITNHDEFKNEFQNFQNSSALQSAKEISWLINGIEQFFTVSFLRNADNSIIAVGVQSDDIVSVRRELEIQRAKSEQSARLATLGEMAAGIAHEINNPLAVVVGFCSRLQRVLAEEKIDLEKSIEYINKITQTSFRISKIVTGLRKFSRQSDNDVFIMTSIKSIVEETFDLCREKINRLGIQIEIDEYPEFEVPVRSIQISQILMNLINNSVDAVQNAENKLIKISFHHDLHYMYIHVTDHGHGIQQELTHKVFQPFFTTKDVGMGTGLGLSIAKGIALDHQGELSITSSRSPTTITLKLPLQRSEVVEIRNAS